MADFKKHVFLFFALIISIIAVCTSCGTQVDEKNIKSSTQPISNEDEVISSIGEIYSSCLSQDDIYATSYILPESEINLTDTTDIYNHSDLVLVGTVISKNGGKMLDELQYAGLCGKMSIEKVIKGDYTDSTIQFCTCGGFCTIEEYIASLSKSNPEKIEKMGFDTIDNNTKKNKYLVFNYKYGKNFSENTKYVLMLKKIGDNYVCVSNFGFLEVTDGVDINNLNDILKLV